MERANFQRINQLSEVIEVLGKKELANCINHHFMSVAGDSHDIYDNQELESNLISSFHFNQVTEDEVSNIITLLDSNKSSGPSNISTSQPGVFKSPPRQFQPL